MATQLPQIGCSTLTLPGLTDACSAVVGLGQAGVNTATGAVAGSVTDKIGSWLVDGVAGAGQSLIEGLDSTLTAATTPNLGAAWFLGNYSMVLGIALVVSAVTFIVQIVSSLVRREPGMLSRAVTGSAVGVIGGFAVLTVCQMLLVATDELCSGLLQTSGHGSLTSSLSDGWTVAMAALGPGAWLLAVFLGLLFIIGVVMLWVVMFLREIGIYVLAVFAPIAFAGFGWDSTRAWLRRWGQVVAALIFSKIVIYIVFLLALAMLSGTPQANNVLAAITQMIGGIVMLWMAAMSPWAVHRFISFAGSATDDLNEHEGPRSAVGASSMMAISTGMVVGRKVGNIVGGAAAGGAPGAAAGAAAPAGGGQLPGQAAQAATPTTSGGGSGGGGTSSPAPSSSPGGSGGAGGGGGGGTSGGSSGGGSGAAAPGGGGASGGGAGGSAAASPGGTKGGGSAPASTGASGGAAAAGSGAAIP